MALKHWGFLLYLPLLGMLMCVSYPALGADSVGNAKRQFALLAGAIQHDKIIRIEVFYIPKSVETFADISPKALRQHYKYKLEVRCSQSSNRLSQLYNAVIGTKPSIPISGDQDFRWGCIAYSDDPRVRWEIYLGRWGKNAEINGLRIGVNSSLSKWLTKNTEGIKTQNF